MNTEDPKMTEVKIESAPLREPNARQEQDFSHLVPKTCDGAMPFNLILGGFCIFAVAAPIVLLTVGVDDTADSTLRIIGVLLLSLGILYCCFSIRKVICGGVVNVPPPAPLLTSIAKAKEGEKQHFNVAVKKLYVIVNPHGGLKRGPTILKEQCMPVWEEAGIEVDVKETEYAGHATDYARTLPLEGYDALCIIGGDGSFFEMVNGLLTRPDKVVVPVGLIPGGSGNSVMCDLGCWSAKEAAARIAAGDVCYTDANRVTDDGSLDVFSVNEISWGLVGDVGITSECIRWCGPARYDICAFWGVMKNKLKGCQIVTKDEKGNVLTSVQGQVLTAFVNQTQHFGKGMRATPFAKIDDGQMDLVVCPRLGADPSRGELVQILQQMPAASHKDNPNVEQFQVYECAITPDTDEGLINIDGENFPYQGTISVKCLHKILPMFIPPEYKPMSTKMKKSGQGGSAESF